MADIRYKVYHELMIAKAVRWILGELPYFSQYIFMIKNFHNKKHSFNEP